MKVEVGESVVEARPQSRQMSVCLSNVTCGKVLAAQRERPE